MDAIGNKREFGIDCIKEEFLLHRPLISIITVVFNDKQYIENTIVNILGQAYENIEFIIVDGGSTDGTLDLIKKYESEIDILISEPDRGIYDAMNKGISLANGKWIIFINSGDYLEKDILTKIFFDNLHENDDIIYGDVVINKQNQHYLEKAKPMETFNYFIPFCHQSCLVRAKLYKENLFSLDYKICADYDFFLRCYKNNLVFKYIELPFSIFLFGGVSSNRKWLYAKEKLQIISNYNKMGITKYYYQYKLLKSLIPFNRRRLNFFKKIFK